MIPPGPARGTYRAGPGVPFPCTTGSEAEAVEIFANAFNLNVEDYR